MILPGLISFGLLLALPAFAQGLFVYDQQSSTETNIGGGVVSIQSDQPLGQSFMPSLSGVGFIRLYVSDGIFDGLGATVRVNLRTNSVSGLILATTDVVAVADRFSGTVNFLFNSEVPVSAGGTYYFQPELVSGGNFGVAAYNTFGYSRGNAYYQGVMQTFNDIWFREGVIVLEPTITALLILGGGLYAWRWRKTQLRE